MNKTGAFSEAHPVVGLTYFAAIIGITMFSMHPFFLAMTFIVGFTYSILLNGIKSVKFNILILLPVIIIMAVVNPLFTHRGVTILFWLNGNAITLEAIVYGIAMATMLTSTVIWFSCASRVMTPDKFIYLFGRILPVIALTLSMSFRFVPLLKKRYKEITMGQQCLGMAVGKNIFSRIRSLARVISILISWSFEAAIETSDSMESRGYGLKGRTSYHLFCFTARDGGLMAIIIALSGVIITGCANGVNKILYYPAIIIEPLSPLSVIVLISYFVLLILPILVDIRGELKWKQLYLKM